MGVISAGALSCACRVTRGGLEPGEVVTLRSGVSFGKKLCWKRGRGFAERIEEELRLLGHHYDDVDRQERGGLQWFRVADLRTPEDWSPGTIDVVFSVTQGYPGAQPYGFFVPVTLMRAGAPPSEHAAPHQPPFPGTSPVGWRPTADVQTGSNLWGWVRSFVQRLREGQ